MRSCLSPKKWASKLLLKHSTPHSDNMCLMAKARGRATCPDEHSVEQVGILLLKQTCGRIVLPKLLSFKVPSTSTYNSTWPGRHHLWLLKLGPGEVFPFNLSP